MLSSYHTDPPRGRDRATPRTRVLRRANRLLDAQALQAEILHGADTDRALSPRSRAHLRLLVRAYAALAPLERATQQALEQDRLALEAYHARR